MKLLIKNANIDGQILNILISDGKITEISNKITDCDNVYDAKENYIFSGNCNAYFNGSLEDCDRLLCQGVTSIFDFSNDLDVTKRLVELGFKVFTAVGDFDGCNVLTRDYLDEKVEELKKLGIVSPILFLSNINIDDENQYNELIQYSKSNNLIIATNVSETLDEVGDIDKRFGQSPIGVLESYGFLDFKNMLLGGVYIDKEDVEILKNYDSTVCVRPSYDLKCGNGISPVYSLLKNNINIVVGGVCQSMFQEVDLVKNLQAGILNEEGIVKEQDAIGFANNNCSKLFDVIGGLRVGDYADLIVCDDKYFNCTPHNVKAVFVDGECIYSNDKE